MVKLSDIARDLDLSLSVVSRALSANPDKNAVVKKETADRIREYARKVGYTPNRQASFLGKGKCATIFCFLSDVPTSITADLMFGITEAARETNFPVNFFFGRNSGDLSRFLRESQNNPHAGLLTLPSTKMPAEVASEFERYHHDGGKILFLNTISNSGPMFDFSGYKDVPTINIDEEFGGKLAADHLMNCGCDHILLLSSGQPYVYGVRENGFADLLEKHHVDFDRVDFDDFKKMNLTPGKRWGIFADCDYDALNIYPHLAARGLQLGKDVFLCGFDDIFYTRISQPSLTTVHQPRREEGRTALYLLVDMIFGARGENRLIRPWLCRRESTGGARPDPEHPELEEIITSFDIKISKEIQK